MRNVLFLCTGNSARSIMAEAYLNDTGNGEWKAYSAGSRPVGAPNPYALRTLDAAGITLRSLPRSKSWDAFALPDAPVMDFVITVCDNAAGEECPVWPMRAGRQPRKIHWSFLDPAAAEGDDEAILAVFENIFSDIQTRIDAFLGEYDQ